VSIWVCGEVLIDLLPGEPERIAVVGGGPANTAKALSRLGHDVQFIVEFLAMLTENQHGPN
jgi:fructokinase